MFSQQFPTEMQEYPYTVQRAKLNFEKEGKNAFSRVLPVTIIKSVE